MTSPHGPGRTDAAGGIDHGTAALRAETLSAETLSAENLTAEKLSAKKQGAVNRDAFHLGAIGAGLAFAGSLPALQAALDGSQPVPPPAGFQRWTAASPAAAWVTPCAASTGPDPERWWSLSPPASCFAASWLIPALPAWAPLFWTKSMNAASTPTC